MSFQNLEQPKLDDLFLDLTLVKSWVQLQQQTLVPHESQDKSQEEEIIPYKKPTIKERQPLSWTSGKKVLRERRPGISAGCRAEGFTTLETGWQHWRWLYLHRINLQSSKGGWADSEGQSGILFRVSEFSDEQQYPPLAMEPEGI